MRDDKTGTDEELNTPDTARTIPTRREDGTRASGDGRVVSTRIAEPLGARVRRRQPAGRTVHGKQQKPKQLSDMLPYPNPVSADTADDKPCPTLEGMR